MAAIKFEGVTKTFGDVVAVDDLSLEIADREFLVLLGPSGCGKSTALRMIAGLEEPSTGTISIGGDRVNGIEPKYRDVAMVFQSYALYPHMTVRRNIEFPLKSTKVPADERAKLVTDAADTLGLADLLDRKPAQLSGGQRQRVALARAIVRNPRAFLMDEPLSNLDAKLRVRTRAELVELQQRLAATVVYVTHDQIEAMTMGHRIAVMSDGRLEQIGEPQEVYDRPASLFVAGFIGTPPMNVMPGTALPEPLVRSVTARSLETVVIGVRPEHARIDAGGVIPAIATVVESLGHERNIGCRLHDDTLLIVRQESAAPVPDLGDAVHLAVEPARLHVFDVVSGRRIDE